MKAWITEALDTLRRLPDREAGWIYGSQKAQWPDVWQSAADAFGVDVQRVRTGQRTDKERKESDALNRRGPASAMAVSRMHCVMRWTKWIPTDQAKVVMLRAQNLPWGAIQARTGYSKSTAQRREKAGLNEIANKLNDA